MSETIDLQNISINSTSAVTYSQRGGLVLERERLTEAELDSLVEFVFHKPSIPKIWAKNELRFFLNHIFANVFMDMKTYRLLGSPSDHPARLKVIGEQLDEIIKKFPVTKNPLSSGACDDLRNHISDLYKNPDTRLVLYFIDFLTGLAPHQRFPKTLAIWIGKTSDKEINRLMAILPQIREHVRNKTERGGNGKPQYKQLVRAVAGLYFEATGLDPKRHYNAYKCRDTGPLHRLCQQMAIIIENHMPEDLKQEPPTLNGICEDIIKELKAEIAHVAA